jgi:Polysaccharide biosynthesis protein
VSTVDSEVALAESAAEYAETQTAAFVAVRSMVVRHVLVGILSALGTTLVIRRLGPQLWGAFGVAYLLLVTMDSIVARGILAGLARRSVHAGEQLVASAVRLALYSGVALAAAIMAMVPLIRLVYDPPNFMMLLGASAVACVLYAGRAVPSILLERELRYWPIAAAEVADNLAFYAVALPALVLLHYGLAAIVVALVARALASFVVIRLAYRAPWIGRPARDAARLLLPFGVPLCLTFVLAVIDGLVAVFVIGGHERQLGFMLVGGTVLGYGVAVVTAAARVALPSFSRVDAIRLGWSVRRSVALATFLTFALLVPAIGLAEIWVSPVFGPVWELGGIPYLQMMGVALTAAGPIGVLSGALLARGDSRVVLQRHAMTIAIYGATALLLTAIFGPIGCLVALVLSRWSYTALLAAASRTRLGFHVDAELATPVMIGTAWLGVVVILAPRSAVGAIVAAVGLGAVWLWFCRDLAGAALRAARAGLADRSEDLVGADLPARESLRQPGADSHAGSR